MKDSVVIHEKYNKASVKGIFYLIIKKFRIWIIYTGAWHIHHYSLSSLLLCYDEIKDWSILVQVYHKSQMVLGFVSLLPEQLAKVRLIPNIFSIFVWWITFFGDSNKSESHSGICWYHSFLLLYWGNSVDLHY